MCDKPLSVDSIKLDSLSWAPVGGVLRCLSHVQMAWRAEQDIKPYLSNLTFEFVNLILQFTPSIELQQDE